MRRADRHPFRFERDHERLIEGWDNLPRFRLIEPVEKIRPRNCRVAEVIRLRRVEVRELGRADRSDPPTLNRLLSFGGINCRDREGHRFDGRGRRPFQCIAVVLDLAIPAAQERNRPLVRRKRISCSESLLELTLAEHRAQIVRDALARHIALSPKLDTFSCSPHLVCHLCVPNILHKGLQTKDSIAFQQLR